MAGVPTLLRAIQSPPLLIALIGVCLGCASQRSTTERPATQTVEELNPAIVTVRRAEAQAKGGVGPDDVIPAQEVVFRTEGEWTTFWKQYGEQSPPVVDFTRMNVAAVFLGPSAPGHTLMIQRMTYDGASRRTVVFVTEVIPEPKGPSISIDVYPSAIVQFPARPGGIVFERVRKRAP
jgi:hypothetical protein